MQSDRAPSQYRAVCEWGRKLPPARSQWQQTVRKCLPRCQTTCRRQGASWLFSDMKLRDGTRAGPKVRGGAFSPPSDLASSSKMNTGIGVLCIASACLCMWMKARGRGVLLFHTPHYSLETLSLELGWQPATRYDQLFSISTHTVRDTGACNHRLFTWDLNTDPCPCTASTFNPSSLPSSSRTSTHAFEHFDDKMGFLPFNTV